MFCINNNCGYNAILVDTMEEMFIGLRTDMEIPEKIERKYEKMFLLYKLNDFNEL